MTTLFNIVLSFVAGLGIPVMAAMNSRVSLQLGSSVSVVLLCFTALLFSLVFFFFNSGKVVRTDTGGLPLIYYAAGGFIVFYILAITFSVREIGLGLTIFMVLSGQIFSSMAIDHYGLFLQAQQPMALPKLVGVMLILSGIYLAHN